MLFEISLLTIYTKNFRYLEARIFNRRFWIFLNILEIATVAPKRNAIYNVLNRQEEQTHSSRCWINHFAIIQTFK